MEQSSLKPDQPNDKPHPSQRSHKDEPQDKPHPSQRSHKEEAHDNDDHEEESREEKPERSQRSQKSENQNNPKSQQAHEKPHDKPNEKPQEKPQEKSPQKPIDKGSDKTFLTSKPVEETLPYTLHDLLFPAGKVAKLCKITDATSPSLRFGQACSRFGFEKPSPVIVLSGAIDSNRSKFYAGICRAAFRTDAVIIDSGVKSGIEQFTLRRRVKLVGVFPESEIILPKVSPTDKQWNELANGHTHLFMICEQPSKSYRWNDEGEIKLKIAKQIAEGTSKAKMPRCKIVTVVMGDNEHCTNDIIQSINNNLPVIIVGGSQVSNDIIKVLKGDKSPVKLPHSLLEAFKLKTAHIYCLEDNNSEEIASFLHFFLTVTPF